MTPAMTSTHRPTTGTNTEQASYLSLTSAEDIRAGAAPLLVDVSHNEEHRAQDGDHVGDEAARQDCC